MAQKNMGKLTLMLIASILIGAVLMVYVTYSIMDSLHMGTTESETLTLPAVKTDGHFNLTYTPTSAGVTYMQLKVAAYNGTAPVKAGTITLTNRYVFVNYVNSKDGANGAVRNDTTAVVANYTTVGGEVRPFIAPVAALLCTLGIVVIAIVMLSTLNFGGGKKGGRKSFP